MLASSSRLILLGLISQALTAQAGNYTLRDDIAGADFFKKFTWWNYGDPTHGTVDYVSQSRARSMNLSYVDSRGKFVMRADTSEVPRNGNRKSVRIHSQETMGDGLLVARFSWMPQGCGTWPAFWTATRQMWPHGGEIDIIEGANDAGPRNLASLHTTEGCNIAAGTSPLSTGFAAQTNCSYQPGCSNSFSLENSFGPNLNQGGGGWFAMTRDTVRGGAGISVYFWPASTPLDSMPSAVAAAAGSAPKFVLTDINRTAEDAAKWGLSAAHFTNDGMCDMSQFFGQQEIIINLTFCGDWAGETFSMIDKCAKQSCSNFVKNNPAAFEDARWEVDYVRVYTDAALRPAALSLLTVALLASSVALLVSL